MPFCVDSNTIAVYITGEGGDNTSTTGDQSHIVIAIIGNVDIIHCINSNTRGNIQCGCCSKSSVTSSKSIGPGTSHSRDDTSTFGDLSNGIIINISNVNVPCCVNSNTRGALQRS